MKQTTLPHQVVAASICALLLCIVGTAQQQSAPQSDKQKSDKSNVSKVEIGAQYSQVYLNDFGSFSGISEANPSPAVGGRVTYNLTDHLAVEAEANFFPVVFDAFSTVVGGRALQGLFGVKAGKRFRHFGLFAKARPGLISFSETERPVIATFTGIDGSTFPFPNFVTERKTHFALDVGGVLEVYASRRVFARFDAGDTIIHYGRHDDFSDSFDDLLIVSAPARTQHYLQISAGVGVRIGARRDEAGATTRASAARPNKATRFEAGAQFTSLSFSPITPLSSGGFIFGTSNTVTEPGFGGRFTYNLTRYLAVEAETNWLPRSLPLAIGASGRITQGLFGVKAGHRFHSFGVFAKARPGFVSFSSSLKQVGSVTLTNPVTHVQFTRGIFEVGRRTFFAADVGGVFELYPSRRWLVRFDGGDTIIRYGERSIANVSFIPPTFTTPPETRHNLQFSTGVGFRF